MKALRDEYQNRVHYISYLAKSRQKLLNMQSKIQGLLSLLNREKDSCFASLIQESVRIFLDKQDSRLEGLKLSFIRLQSHDEKVHSQSYVLFYMYY